MVWLFWLSFAVVFYAYVGYALCLALLARLRPLPVQKAMVQPTVSILLAAHNEAENLPGKLQNLSELDYPSDRLEVLVVSDGSSDSTDAYLAEQTFARFVLLPEKQGKAFALNRAAAESRGELLVFMDVRQLVDKDAVRQLAANFADSNVGAVSGELHLVTTTGEPSPDALGLYWRIEKTVRKLESMTGSVVGATGALYAIRRDLFLPIPSGTLLDDVLIPMQVVRLGKRCIFEPQAIARDMIFGQRGKEFSRKVRTLTGNYQMLRLAPWLLTPANPLLFRLVSHKLLRLAVPVFLLGMLVGSLFTAGLLMKVALALQMALYVLALLGALQPGTRRWKPVSVAFTFTMLNVAAARALYNFLGGRAQWA